MSPSILIMGCGALGRELAELRRLNNWSQVALRCLPDELHNRPDRIAPTLRAAIEAGRREFEHIFVAFADCGSSGDDPLVVFSPSGKRGRFPCGAARPLIEERVRMIEKMETAIEADFQRHFVAALAIPHQVDAFTELAGAVDLPARCASVPAGSRRRARR